MMSSVDQEIKVWSCPFGVLGLIPTVAWVLAVLSASLMLRIIFYLLIKQILEKNENLKSKSLTT